MEKVNSEIYLKEVLSIINTESKRIFLGEEVDKFYATTRKIVELTLKVIVANIHPTIDVEFRMLASLIPLVTDSKRFNKEFTSFLFRCKNYGNDEIHYKLSSENIGKEMVMKMELNLYLMWFYKVFLNHKTDEVIEKWHKVNILEIEKPIIITESTTLIADIIENNTENIESRAIKRRIDATWVQIITDHKYYHKNKLQTHIHKEEWYREFKYIEPKNNGIYVIDKDKPPYLKPGIYLTFAIMTTEDCHHSYGRSINGLMNENLFLVRLISRSINNWADELLKNSEQLDVMDFNLHGIYISDYFYNDEAEFDFYYDSNYLRRHVIYFLISKFIKEQIDSLRLIKNGNNYEKMILQEKYERVNYIIDYKFNALDSLPKSISPSIIINRISLLAEIIEQKIILSQLLKKINRLYIRDIRDIVYK